MECELASSCCHQQRSHEIHLQGLKCFDRYQKLWSDHLCESPMLNAFFIIIKAMLCHQSFRLSPWMTDWAPSCPFPSLSCCETNANHLVEVNSASAPYFWKNSSCHFVKLAIFYFSLERSVSRLVYPTTSRDHGQFPWQAVRYHGSSLKQTTRQATGWLLVQPGAHCIDRWFRSVEDFWLVVLNLVHCSSVLCLLMILTSVESFSLSKCYFPPKRVRWGK